MSQPPGSESGEEPTRDIAGSDFPSQAYSAPESEQFTSGPYVPADPHLYDYDSYESSEQGDDDARPPRWPWVVAALVVLSGGYIGGATPHQGVQRKRYVSHDRRNNRPYRTPARRGSGTGGTSAAAEPR